MEWVKERKRGNGMDAENNYIKGRGKWMRKRKEERKGWSGKGKYSKQSKWTRKERKLNKYGNEMETNERQVKGNGMECIERKRIEREKKN